MLTFSQTMDPHSNEIRRDGQFLGFVQWHPDKEPRILIMPSVTYLTVSETEACLAQIRKEKAK